MSSGSGEMFSLSHLVTRRRYFDDDEFFDDGNELREAFTKCHCITTVLDGDASDPNHKSQTLLLEGSHNMLSVAAERFHCHISGCKKSFKTIAQYSSHYAVAHRHSCHICGASLPNVKLLDMHVAERHDSFFAAQAARQASYACLVDGCPFKAWNAKQRAEHLTSVHKYPIGYTYDLQRKGGRRRWAHKHQNFGSGNDSKVMIGASTKNKKTNGNKRRSSKKKTQRRRGGGNSCSAAEISHESQNLPETIEKDQLMDVDRNSDDSGPMEGLTNAMQRVSMVPRSISFGRRSRNRVLSKSGKKSIPYQKCSSDRVRKSGANSATAKIAAESNSGSPSGLNQRGLSNKRPNRRERRAAARASLKESATLHEPATEKMDLDD